jgi:hypothetical protein
VQYFERSANRTVTVTNTGNATLQISSILAIGSYFGVTTTSCYIALAPGANCTINTWFDAYNFGQNTAILNIKSNAPNSPALVTLKANCLF